MQVEIVEILLVKIFKVIHGLTDNIDTANYNLRSQADLSVPSINSSYKGLISLMEAN